MHHRGVGTCLQETVHDDVPMAFGVIVLEAEQRHHAAIQELAHVRKSMGGVGGVEDLAVPRQGLRLTGTEPGAVVLRVAQGTVMDVLNACGAESCGELHLRQAGPAAEGGQAHIHEHSHVLREQLRDEVADGLPLVADANKGARALNGVSGYHEFQWCITSRAGVRRTWVMRCNCDRDWGASTTAAVG